MKILTFFVIFPAPLASIGILFGETNNIIDKKIIINSAIEISNIIIFL
jgi:hypothetical protein